jgi:hypothetical protein
MVTMTRNFRHLFSRGESSDDTIAPEVLDRFLDVAARGRPRPGFDRRTLLASWLTAARTSDPPPFVNRMVRRWISRQAFDAERFSSPAA